MSKTEAYLIIVLLCCFTSCDHDTSQTMINKVKDACSYFDSLNVSAWRNVYEGVYGGVCIVNGDDEKLFSARFNRWPVYGKPNIEYRRENHGEISQPLPMPSDSCREELARLLLICRELHIVQLNKGAYEFYFTKGDLLHSIKRYDIRE